MGRLHRPASVLLAAGAAALVACPDRDRPPAAPSPDGAATAAGIRLSLPEGWTAHPQGPERLAFGPAGKVVATLDRQPQADLPTPENLKSEFSSGLGDVPVKELDRASGPDHVQWLGRVHPPQAPSWVVGLCARRAGESLFLGATAPGATEAEVRAALEACASLGWR